MFENLVLVAGHSNGRLAAKIAQSLGKNLAVVQGASFPNSEENVQIPVSVRGKPVCLIQSVARSLDPDGQLRSPNDNWAQLLLILDALVRADAASITLVMPYHGYARQDRKDKPHTPISATVIARSIELIAGDKLDRILCLDLHASQIQGFYRKTVDNLYGSTVFKETLLSLKDEIMQKICGRAEDNICVLCPDLGSTKVGRAIGDYLGLDLAIIEKRRVTSTATEVMSLIGNISGKHCIMIDDICASGSTMCNAASVAVNTYGARSVSAFVSHADLTESAIKNINKSALSSVTFLDTVSPLYPAEEGSPKIRRISAAPILAESIYRICKRGNGHHLGLSGIFAEDPVNFTHLTRGGR